MAENRIPQIDIESIANRRKRQWMIESAKHRSIQERVALTVPWWLIIIAAGLFALSASHTAGVFFQLSSVGYAGPFVVEFALLWAAFGRVTSSRRTSSAMRVLEVLAFIMALLANGIGSVARVASMAGIDQLSTSAIFAAYGKLPVTTQAYILFVPLFALFIPVGTWVAGEGLASLVMIQRREGSEMEKRWAEVQVPQLAQALYAELVKNVEFGIAKRLSMSMSLGYYNVVRQPIRLDSPASAEIKAIPDVSTVSAMETPKSVRTKSRTTKTASSGDMRKAVHDYLDGHPEASTMSVRQLASMTGVSKSLAAEELSTWKAAHQ